MSSITHCIAVSRGCQGTAQMVGSQLDPSAIEFVSQQAVIAGLSCPWRGSSCIALIATYRDTVCVCVCEWSCVGLRVVQDCLAPVKRPTPCGPLQTTTSPHSTMALIQPELAHSPPSLSHLPPSPFLLYNYLYSPQRAWIGQGLFSGSGRSGRLMHYS